MEDPCADDDPKYPVETRHVVLGLTPIEEYQKADCPSPTPDVDWELAREFLWGDRFPEPLVMFDWTAAGDVAAGSPEKLYYLRDVLGSVVGLAKPEDQQSSGTQSQLVERYVYDPYGKTIIESWNAIASEWVRVDQSSYGNPWMWIAQRFDAAVGLNHFLVRSYSPELGRWLQRDPLGYVDGVNLAAYARSAPVALIDRLGGWAEPPQQEQSRAPAGRNWADDIFDGDMPDFPGPSAANHVQSINELHERAAQEFLRATGGNGYVPGVDQGRAQDIILKAADWVMYIETTVLVGGVAIKVISIGTKVIWKGLAKNAPNVFLESTDDLVRGATDDAGRGSSSAHGHAAARPPKPVIIRDNRPRLTNNYPKHHPVTGRTKEPRNVREIFDGSISDNGKEWWGKDDRGYVHRFHGANKPGDPVHWSGSTGDPCDPLDPEHIPPVIRKALGV